MTPFPTKAQILAFLDENPTLGTKRDIARAFGIHGARKIDLKALLAEMEEAGEFAPTRRKTRGEPGRLPPVAVIEVTGADADGDLLARPFEQEVARAAPAGVVIRLAPGTAPAGQGLGPGDRVLARLAPLGDGEWEARPIRRLGASPGRILGIFRREAGGGRILPVDKGEARQWVVGPGLENGAQDGELVEAEATGPKGRLGLPKARVIAVLGDPSGPRAVSLIAIRQHGIPDAFPHAALAEAEAAAEPPLGDRTDLRDLPLVTIDPEDARDRDDAVLAVPEGDGFRLWVAIADVAAVVRPGSALDAEAWTRGNSTYFPDRVVPMLPDRLSGDLCSLHEGVDRAVLAVEMRIDAEGNKLSHRFVRGLMRSRGSLEYGQVQRAVDGEPDAATAPLLDSVLRPLFAAYGALRRARDAREPLDLDLPERRIVLSPEGRVLSVAFKDRLDAHRLIEEFMVLANVAAAEELVARRTPLLFRVHEEPDPLRIDSLREIAEASGLTLAKGQVMQTRVLNRLLRQAAQTTESELISMATLRSLPQAYYGADNLGHFGLALKHYAHFTSPIRRYADLVVHRALIAAHRFGPDGLTASEIERLDATGEQISMTERRSMMAERDTTDRYLAAFLADRVGALMEGRVSGVARFGLFVKLDESGADGLVPVRSLGAEFWRHDAQAQTLTGAESGTVLAVGMAVRVKLAEVSPMTGGIVLELVEVEERTLPRGGARRRGPGPARRPGRDGARSPKARTLTRRR